MSVEEGPEDQAFLKTKGLTSKEVNASSMVGLKAELARTQHMVSRAKQIANGTVIKSNVVKPASVKVVPKNKGVADRDQRDQKMSAEEAQTLDHAAKILAQKAALYDKLASGERGVLSQDQESSFLVDFEQKELDRVNVQSHSKGPIVKVAFGDVEVYPAKNWVEYTDSLGRQRVCLRKDLAALREMDESINPSKGSDDDENHNVPPPPPQVQTAPVDDTPAPTKKATDPIHFQDVMKNETRVLGAGYFAFSNDEETRAEQMTALNQLRTQTLEQRQRAEKLKQRRNEAKEDRLRKIKMRKFGAAPEDTSAAEGGQEDPEQSLEDSIDDFLARARKGELS